MASAVRCTIREQQRPDRAARRGNVERSLMTVKVRFSPTRTVVP
jgi:hypothetical protein